MVLSNCHQWISSHKWLCATVHSICLLAFCSCNSGPERYSLSGQVSYDGQPVTDGEIIFSPLDDTTGIAASTIIRHGKYEIVRSAGPTAGKYDVDITGRRPTGRLVRGEGSSGPIEAMAQYIPSAYNSETTLQVEIDSDRDDLDFHLMKISPSLRRR